MEKKHNYIYRITDVNTIIQYIGVHSTDNMNDGYMGSGIALKSVYAKYAFDYSNFKKEIIADFDNRISALAYERALVTPEFVKSNGNYNLVKGGGYIGIPANKYVGRKWDIKKRELLNKLLNNNIQRKSKYILKSNNFERSRRLIILNHYLGNISVKQMNFHIDIIKFVSDQAHNIVSLIKDEKTANRFRQYGLIIESNGD